MTMSKKAPKLIYRHHASTDDHRSGYHRETLECAFTCRSLPDRDSDLWVRLVSTTHEGKPAFRVVHGEGCDSISIGLLLLYETAKESPRNVDVWKPDGELTAALTQYGADPYASDPLHDLDGWADFVANAVYAFAVSNHASP